MLDTDKIKERAEAKVEEVSDKLETKWTEKPIVRVMTYAFVGIVILLGIFAVFNAAEGSPRTDAATVVITGGK